MSFKMNHLIDIFKKNKIIIFIVLLAGLIRFYGIEFGYPFNVNMIWDETNGMTYLLDVLQGKNIFAVSSQYPILLPLVYLPLLALRLIFLAVKEGLYSIADLKNYLVEYGIGNIYIIIRWCGVLFGTATVFAIYKIYRIITENKYFAYFAASAYALSSVPVAMSHWGKTHNAMIFFLILSLLYIIKFEKNKSLNYFYLSLIFSSLSFSAHYIGISAFIFPFLGVIFNGKKFDFKIIVKSFFIFLPIILVFYLTTYQGILSMIQNINENYYSNTGFTGLFAVGKLERFYYVFRDSFYIEPVFVSLFLFFLALKIKKIFRHKYTRYIFCGILFNYLLMISIIVGPELSRWLLVFLSLAVPLGAFYFAEFVTGKIANQKIIALIFIILLAPSFYFNLKWLKLLNNSTYAEVNNWLEKNLKENEIVYSFNLEFVPQLSYQAALYQRDYNNVKTSDKINHIISNKEKYEDKGIDLYYDLGKKRYKELGGEQTKYVILYHWLSGDKNKRTMIQTKKSMIDSLDEIKKYHKIELVQSFCPAANKDFLEDGIGDYINNPLKVTALRHLEKSGPFFEIYKIYR